MMASSDLNGNTTPMTDSAIVKSHIKTILQKSTAILFERYRGEYKCFHCERTFLFPSILREHTINLHKHVDYDQSLRIWTQFGLGNNLLLDIQMLRCRVCYKNMANINDLKIHYSENHDEFLPNFLLDTVICFKLRDDKNRCPKCRNIFENFDDLLNHVKSHDYITCENCEENFNTKKEYMEHDRPNCKPCSLCNMRFDTKKRRDAHLKYIHCKGFQCDFCSQQFTMKETLARHIRNLHYKEKNETCDICGKLFFDSHHLNLHKIRHLNTKSFECQLCNKKFARNDALKLHLRIHNNDRRYVCTVCGKAFVQWVSLHMHKVVHTTERKFKCQACDKAFKDKKTLKKHCLNVHQKEDEIKSELLVP